MIVLVETEDVTLKMNHCTVVQLHLVYHYVLLVYFYLLSKVGALRHVVENAIGKVALMNFSRALALIMLVGFATGLSIKRCESIL